METDFSTSESRRHRSSRRLRHEAQVKVFENQAGSLEKIRLQLGLRPSQICELLKVHPSAWTRWTKQGVAPPHVYQMLDWYLELLQWRGQNKLTNPTALRREDPSTYVPAETGSANSCLEITSSPNLNGLTRWLLVAWCIQTFLWCIVITLLIRHS